MSSVIIYLGLPLPAASSDQPEAGGPRTPRFGLASDGVYNAASVTRDAVVSYSALSPLPYPHMGLAVYFLLHFPGSHLHRPLAGILAL